MRYTRFEELVLIIGGVTILGSIAVSYTGGPPELAAVTAQLMLFAVLAVAVRYGRRGGLVAAIVASAVYTVIRFDTFMLLEASYSALFVLTAHLIAFGVVGVAVGEMCSQAKYRMASLEGANAVDEWSRVFNQRWAHRALDAARGRYRRYNEPFSIVIVSVAHRVFDGLTPSRQRVVVRGIADHVRADVRVVDEVARLDNGLFVVLLPHTPKSGGEVAANRLMKGTVAALGARDESRSNNRRLRDESRAPRTRLSGVRRVQVRGREHTEPCCREHLLGPLIVDAEDVDRSVPAGIDEAVRVLNVESRCIERLEKVREATRTVGDFDGEDSCDRRTESGVVQKRLRALRRVADDANDPELARVSNHERVHVHARITQCPGELGQST